MRANPQLDSALWRDLENGAVGTAPAKGCPKQVFAAVEGDASIGKESVVRRAGKAVQHLLGPLAVMKGQLENGAVILCAAVNSCAIQVPGRVESQSAARIISIRGGADEAVAASASTCRC